jgi:hypothetical protein
MSLTGMEAIRDIKNPSINQTPLLPFFHSAIFNTIKEEKQKWTGGDLNP